MKKIGQCNLIFLIPVYILITILIICSMFGLIKFEEKSIYSGESSDGNTPYMIMVKFSDGTIKQVGIEEYLIGVVSAEMPPSFESEALKAQAVAARTYIINRQRNKASDHPDADVCTDPSHCKAYITEQEALNKWHESWNNEYKTKIKDAVNSTCGMIITYENEPITAVFHSTSSGKTENSGEVWQSQAPYLKSVKSEGEELSPRYKSTVEISRSEFINKIKNINKLASFPEENISITDYTYTEGGSVKSLYIGGVEFKGTEIRSLFGLRSANFRIILKDNVIFDVTGNGHGVGMSQYGANFAAASGYTYKDIISKYYSGTQIEKLY